MIKLKYRLDNHIFFETDIELGKCKIPDLVSVMPYYNKLIVLIDIIQDFDKNEMILEFVDYKERLKRVYKSYPLKDLEKKLRKKDK
jgi:hypothetical protein